MRQYTLKDRGIIFLQQALDARFAKKFRPSPASTICNTIPLSPTEQRVAGSLMRINHTGEVCAQALYLGQSLTSRTPALRQSFKIAAQEEADHLYWCQERLVDLKTHRSYLNPLWFGGSFLIGAFAGICGDGWSLGFLAETEKQVCEHLDKHLERLPEHDQKSHRVLLQMQKEEAEHAAQAVTLGATPLPWPIRTLMRVSAGMMKQIVYYC